MNKQFIKYKRNRKLKIIRIVSYFILLIFIIFSWYSCKKELGVYPLNEIKYENPFSGNEKITYVSNYSDTIVFEGMGRYTEEIHSPHDGTSNDKYYSNEIDRCTFIDQNNNYELYIQLASRTINTHQGTFSKVITSYLMDTWIKDFSITTENDCQSIASNITLPLSESFAPDIIIDSLLINDIYYHEIYPLHVNILNGYCNEKMKADTIFYSTSYGMVKIVFENNITWEILSIDKK